MVELARRSFLTGLIALGVTAPAIVRVGSLMPVKQMLWTDDDIARLLDRRLDAYVDAVPVAGVYRRYAGYEEVQFDANRNRWATFEEVQRDMERQAKADLDSILNSPRNLSLNRAAV